MDSAPQAPLLIPVSVTYGRRSADVSVPSQMILAELVPALAESLGENAPSLEYPITVSYNGRELSYANSLAAQRVAPGGALALTQTQDPAPARVYDDPVEAIGDQVESSVSSWTSASSTALASAISTALLLLTALLVTISGQNLSTALIAAFAALVATGVASIVARTSPPAAVALAHTAPPLAGAATVAFVGGASPGAAWMSGGIVIAITSVAALVLPGTLRMTALAPATAGIALALVGFSLTAFPMAPAGPASVITLILATILLLAPSLVLTRPQVLDAPPPGQPKDTALDAETIAPRFRTARTAMLSIAAGACGALPFTAALTVLGLGTAPTAATAGTPGTAPQQSGIWGVLLVATIGLVLTLAARTQRSRAEVLIHTITGTVLIAFACFAAAAAYPPAVPAAAAAGLISSFLLLAFAVITPTARPTLSRVAGALQLLGLIGAFPLVIMCWGIF